MSVFCVRMSVAMTRASYYPICHGGTKNAICIKSGEWRTHMGVLRAIAKNRNDLLKSYEKRAQNCEGLGGLDEERFEGNSI